VARRGRPPKSDDARKSAQLSIRITAELRDKLEKAAKENDPFRSISQEIEARLRLSFAELGKAEERFGGPRTYWVFQLIADQIKYLEQVSETSFWKDPFTFDQVKRFIDTVFKALRPRGPSVIPKNLFLGFSKQWREREARSLGERCALLVIAGLQGVLKNDNIRFDRALTEAGQIVPQLRRSGNSPSDDLARQWPKDKKRIEQEMKALKEKQEKLK
jgi:hypothetical protein